MNEKFGPWINIMCAYIGNNDYFMKALPWNALIPKDFIWKYHSVMVIWGFCGSSSVKESTCNAGDPGSIPGSGRSSGEGLEYPLQYSWASLMAQSVKNPPAMWVTWVWSLGWEDPLEEGMAPHSSILAWRIPWTEKPGRLQSMGSQRVRHDWETRHTRILY